MGDSEGNIKNAFISLNFFDEEANTISKFSGFGIPIPQKGDEIYLSELDMEDMLEKEDGELVEREDKSSSLERRGKFKVSEPMFEYTKVRYRAESEEGVQETELDAPLVSVIVNVEKLEDEDAQEERDVE